MKQLEHSDLKSIFAGTGPGGTTVSPSLPPRGDEKAEKSTNTDGSYQPATLPVEPDDG